MTIDFIPQQQEERKPRITVIGVGGAGGNAVNNMINGGLEGVEFVVANTDSQSLVQSLTDSRIQLGVNITHGLGAGARPDIGRVAAEEALDEIQRYLEANNMVFVAAGMGGGTGTGAAPVIARAARELGILTVGVVTKPFQFEGIQRMRIAEEGIRELQQYVDTLIVIPNQNLFRIASDQTTFADAFKLADDVLHAGVRGVTDLMVNPGLVNLDFADIRTVMGEMGKAMMGTGEAEGENRAVEAAESAINNPLLDNTSIEGARGVLINVTGGSDITLHEIDEAASRICREVDEDANIIFGTSLDSELEGRMRVAVIATGIDVAEEQQPLPEHSDKVHVLGFANRRGTGLRGATRDDATPQASDMEPGPRLDHSIEPDWQVHEGGAEPRAAQASPLPLELEPQPVAPEAPTSELARESAPPIGRTHRPVPATSAGAVAATVAAHAPRMVDVAVPETRANATPEPGIAAARQAILDAEEAAEPEPVPNLHRVEDPFIAPPAVEPTIRRSIRRLGQALDGQDRRRGPTLFERMTGTGRARREDQAPDNRREPGPGAQPAEGDTAQSPTVDARGYDDYDREPQLNPMADAYGQAEGRYVEDDPLAIPAFLRRQAN